MVQLNLNDEQKVVLTEVLESALANLSYEIADTDTKDFRDGLKAKRELIQSLADELKSQ